MSRYHEKGFAHPITSLWATLIVTGVGPVAFGKEACALTSSSSLIDVTDGGVQTPGVVMLDVSGDATSRVAHGQGDPGSGADGQLSHNGYRGNLSALRALTVTQFIL